MGVAYSPASLPPSEQPTHTELLPAVYIDKHMAESLPQPFKATNTNRWQSMKSTWNKCNLITALDIFGFLIPKLAPLISVHSPTINVFIAS